MSWAWVYWAITTIVYLLFGHSFSLSFALGFTVAAAFRAGYREAVQKWRKEQARRMLAELKATGRITERFIEP